MLCLYSLTGDDVAQSVPEDLAMWTAGLFTASGLAAGAIEFMTG